MTETFLDAAVRTAHGKSPLRRLRREGHTPAVVYGLNPPLSLQLETRQVERLVHHAHGGERLVELRFDREGKAETRQVLLREIQTVPVTGSLLHIDFQEIDTSKTVHVTVEVRAVGTPQGVTLGGILQAVKHDMVVECLPTAIPEVIEVDVTALNVGDSLHVSDLILPEGVTAVTDPEETVIVISAPRVEVEEEEEVAEGEEGVAAEGAEEEGGDASADSDADPE